MLFSLLGECSFRCSTKMCKFTTVLLHITYLLWYSTFLVVLLEDSISMSCHFENHARTRQSKRAARAIYQDFPPNPRTGPQTTRLTSQQPRAPPPITLTLASWTQLFHWSRMRTCILHSLSPTSRPRVHLTRLSN